MNNRLILLATAGILFSAPANAGLVTYRAHGPINQIIDFSETDESETTSTSWVDLPNASLKLVIPSGPAQLIMVRFTAEAACGAEDPGFHCSVRIMAGNAEMLPNSGADFSIATETVPNAYILAGAAMDRSLALGPGTYTIKVQYETDNAANLFVLDDWHLNVMTADYGVTSGTAAKQKDPGKHPIIRQ